MEADPWCRPRRPGAACACDACQTCTAASWISRRGSGGVAAGDGLGGPCCEAAAPVRTEQRPGNGPGTARAGQGNGGRAQDRGGRVEGTAEAPQLLHPGAHASHRSSSVSTGGTYQQVQSRREFRQCCGSAAAGLVATRVCTGYGARRVTRDAARRCTSLQLHVACVTAAGARPEQVRPRSTSSGTAARHSTACPRRMHAGLPPPAVVAVTGVTPGEHAGSLAPQCACSRDCQCGLPVCMYPMRDGIP